jgi:uncharacterized protein YciI
MGKCLLAGSVMLAVLVGAEVVEGGPRPNDPVFVALYERGSAFVKGKEVPDQPHFRDHVEHLLGRQERLIAGGPFRSRSDDKAVGLVVFQAIDAADAARWTSQDPAVVAGVFKVVVRQWNVTSIRPFELTKP